MTSKTLPALLLAAAVTLSACQGEAPPAPAPTDAAVAASTGGQPAPDRDEPEPVSDTWDRSVAPVAGARLVVEPDPVSFCDGPRQAVEVQWDLAAAAPSHLQLWIEGRNGKRTLWVATKALEGSRRTGDWVTEGMRFVAIDAHGERVLQTAAVNAAECP